MLKTLFIFLISISISFAQESVRPWLGVAIDKGEQGVYIKNSIPNTPAHKAGIVTGDEVLKIDSTIVQTPEQLIEAIASKGVGHEVKIEILRKKKKILKNIILVAKPDAIAMAKNVLLNKPAPEFSADVIKNGKNKKFTNKDLLGKVTILEFWATWCPSCIASYPELTEFAKVNKDKIQVVTVTSEDEKIVNVFLKKFSKRLPQIQTAPITYLSSVDGKMNSEFYASSIPMFFVIDKKGVVRDLQIGSGMVMRKLLNDALNIK